MKNRGGGKTKMKTPKPKENITSQTQKNKYCMIHLYEQAKQVYSVEIKGGARGINILMYNIHILMYNEYT